MASVIQEDWGSRWSKFAAAAVQLFFRKGVKVGKMADNENIE